MEIAGTSDVVWLLTLGVSERPNEKVMNRETLVLYGWTMHEGRLLRALHDGSLVYMALCRLVSFYFGVSSSDITEDVCHYSAHRVPQMRWASWAAAFFGRAAARRHFTCRPGRAARRLGGAPN